MRGQIARIRASAAEHGYAQGEYAHRRSHRNDDSPPVDVSDQRRDGDLAPRSKLRGADVYQPHQPRKSVQAPERKFGTAQDAESGFDAAGGIGRHACSASSIARLTGSPSKAMLAATLRGIRCQRIRCFSTSGRLRQR